MIREPLPNLFFEGGPEWVVLDEDHAYYLVQGSHADGRPYGVMAYHRTPDGGWCGGICFLRPDQPDGKPYLRGDGSPAAVWTIHSMRPLHIEPSVKCTVCEHERGDSGMSHGFIRGDKWEPAGEIPAWAR